MRSGLIRLLAVGTGLAVAATPTAALAHGIGERGDLPLPLGMVSTGAGVVLVASFAALTVLWPRPRLEDAVGGWALPDPMSRAAGWIEWPVRAAGIVAFAAVVATAFLGPPTTSGNLAPVAVYVGLWVGVLLASAVIGDVWHTLSPFETAAAIADATIGPDQRQSGTLPRAGMWPAAALLLGFGWLELVHPSPGDPLVVGAAIVGYGAIIAVGAVWAGRRWVRSAEAFGAFFRLVAAMAPVHRDDAGQLRLRPPLVGLATLTVGPGTTAVVLVALGLTTFDGVTRQPWWQTLVGDRTGWAGVPHATLGLLVTVAVVAGIYLWAMRQAARVSQRPTGELATTFAHSLVPIAVAYAIAHYFSLLVFQGQQLLALASDPIDRGWNLLGTADWTINYTAVSPTTIAWVQIAAIVFGHLAGVILAHDRAVALFPAKTATRSHTPLLLAMVAYTIAGLLLLLAGG